MKQSKGYKRNHTEFIQEANEKHGFKYDYSSTRYVRASEKLSVICPDHGVFTVKAGNHILGSGCPTCRANKVATRKKNRLDNNKKGGATMTYRDMVRLAKVRAKNDLMILPCIREHSRTG